MALSYAASQIPGSKVAQDQAEKPMGEMNTTPLIDVMLVLLIMFILTIPIQTHSVKIDLPIDGEGKAHADKNKLVIDAQSRLIWNDEVVNKARLEYLLAQTQKFDIEPELQFQPHENARYLVVDDVMASIKASGTSKLGFVGNEQYARVF